jgi:hypothetical protein
MRTHTTAILLAITALLALPAAATAGGWATVGLSSTPDGVAAGTAWNVELEILQHGRTPLENVSPSVTITAGDVSRTFAARPAGRPGFYRVSVTFPHAGTWHYVVDDGFTARHPYPAVTIGAGGGSAAASAAAARPTDGGDGGLALDRIGLAGLAALGVAAGALLVPRGRRRRAEGGAGAGTAAAGG